MMRFTALIEKRNPLRELALEECITEEEKIWRTPNERTLNGFASRLETIRWEKRMVVVLAERHSTSSLFRAKSTNNKPYLF